MKGSLLIMLHVISGFRHLPRTAIEGVRASSFGGLLAALQLSEYNSLAIEGVLASSLGGSLAGLHLSEYNSLAIEGSFR